jgi:hypothetical protein
MSATLLSHAVENNSPHISRHLQLSNAHIKFQENLSTSSRVESCNVMAKEWYAHPIRVLFLRAVQRTHNKYTRKADFSF